MNAMNEFYWLVIVLLSCFELVTFARVLIIRDSNEWTMSTKLNMSTIFEFQIGDVSRALLFMLV